MSDRLRSALRTIVRGVQAVDYLALYPAEVLKDWGTHELDLRPDHPDLPLMVRVPLRLFLPGVTVKVQAGARVLLAFEQGDPARPVCQLWEAGSLEHLQLDSGHGHQLLMTDDPASYTAPVFTLTHSAGAKVEMDAAGKVTVTAVGDINLKPSGKVTVNGGGRKVALVNDTVAGGVITGPGSNELEVSK